MAKILIVEDQKLLASNIADFLRADGYMTEICNTAGDAQQLLQMSKFDLLILDWNLPDGDGVSICRSYRSGNGSSAVLILTAKNTVDDKVRGFEAGADDYLTKPFEFRELQVRVSALLRRSVRPTTFLECGPIRLDMSLRTITVSGRPISLLPREYALLEFLARSPGRYFSAEDLIDGVWESETSVSEGAVRQTILRLRKKLGEEAQGLITSAQGQGYRLTSPPVD